MFSQIDQLVGTPQIQLSNLVADTTPRLLPGTIISAVDPYWGAGEFIYARANGTIAKMALCVLTPVFDATLASWRYDATEVPNTANLARPVCVAQRGLSSGEYSWFMLSGVTPVKAGASVAADTSFGITAAGTTGAVAAGKQILNARVMAPATTTVAKANCHAVNGSTKLTLPGNADGWFPGIYLSGTGIAAGTTVVSIDPDNRTVTLSAATTAAVTGTVTGTYNNATIFYNVAHLNRPFAQGAIT